MNYRKINALLEGAQFMLERVKGGCQDSLELDFDTDNYVASVFEKSKQETDVLTHRIDRAITEIHAINMMIRDGVEA